MEFWRCEMEKFVELGEKFGLEGAKLLAFVEKRRKEEKEKKRIQEEKEEKRRQIDEEKEERRRHLEEEKEERQRREEEEREERRRRQDEEREARRQEREIRKLQQEADIMRQKDAGEIVDFLKVRFCGSPVGRKTDFSHLQRAKFYRPEIRSAVCPGVWQQLSPIRNRLIIRRHFPGNPLK